MSKLLIPISYVGIDAFTPGNLLPYSSYLSTIKKGQKYMNFKTVNFHMRAFITDAFAQGDQLPYPGCL